MTTPLYYNNLISIQKKLVNKVIFNKSYIKNSAFSKTSYVLDNYYNSTFLKSKNASVFTNGDSKNSSPHIFTNKLNKDIKFKLITCLFSNKELNLSKFSKSLESAKSLSKNFSTLIFLKVVKGGFRCYYFGLIGFLPRAQANKSFKNLAQSLHTLCNLQSFNSFLMLFNASTVASEKSLIRLSSFTLNNLCVYPTFKKKIFSCRSKKLRTSVNDINIVFVFKAIK
jgi:hypothetical protein